MGLTVLPWIAFLTLIVAVPTALAWSARIGRRVWAPRVFAWRNFLREQPEVREQTDSPVHLVSLRFHSFTSFGFSVGSVLSFELENAGSKPIHSLALSFDSPDPLDTGSIGVQPEAILRPGQAQATRISIRGKGRITLGVDFVQFADGSAWYSHPPRDTVKPAGVRAGAQAALRHLLRVLESAGVPAVLEALARIHAEVKETDFSTREEFGLFGFYCGVTSGEVRVRHAYHVGGLSGVEALLRQR